METTLQGLRVQWDDQKNRINLIKHGFSLKSARLVFSDKNRIEWPDTAHSDIEPRYKVLGRVGKVILVVYTHRGDTIRLISARRATAREREVYYANLRSDGL